MLKFRPLACFYGPHGSWRNSHFSIFFRCFWHFQFLGPKISKCDCEKIVLSETRICSRVKIIPLKAKINGKNKNKIQISKKNWNIFLKIFAFFKFFSFGQKQGFFRYFTRFFGILKSRPGIRDSVFEIPSSKSRMEGNPWLWSGVLFWPFLCSERKI